MANVPDLEPQISSGFTYKGPVSGLRGLISNKIAEGLASVVSTLDKVSEHRSGELSSTEKIPLESIYPCPDQPRQVFDPQSLEQLAQTMKEIGQAQAITVRKTDQGYEIIAGERRWRAAKLAGIQALDCVVKDVAPKEARLLALVENTQRQDLLPVEEAYYLRKVLDENPELSLERLAKRLGSHKSTLSEKIQFTEVPEDLVPFLYGKGRHLTHRHWRVLSRISDVALLRKIFLDAVENHLSVAELERFCTAAGIQKNTRPRSQQGEKIFSSGSKQIQNLVKYEGHLIRFKSGTIHLDALTSEARAQLVLEFEKIVDAFKSSEF
jgi:ParB family chromosome partitioning protein